MYKINYRLLVFIAIFAILAPIQDAHSEVPIGISLPLSGKYKRFAIQFLKGATQAVDDINQYRTHAQKQPLKLVVADDACEKKSSDRAAEIFKQTKVILITGLLCNIAAEIIAEKFTSFEIPVVIGGAQGMYLTDERNRQGWKIFRFSPNDSSMIISAAHILKNHWDLKPYAIIDDGTVHNRRLASELHNKMEDLGIKPQFIGSYQPKKIIYQQLIQQLQKNGISRVFIAGNIDDIINIISYFDKSGFNMEFIGSETLSVLPWIKNIKTFSSKLLAVMRPRPEMLPSAANIIETLFIQSEGFTQYAFNGYAAIQIADQAVNSNKLNPVSVIKSESFDTVLGKIQFNKNGENIYNPFILHRWNGKQFLPIDFYNKKKSSE